MSGMSVAPWWLIGAAVLFALAFANALLGTGAEADGTVTLAIQLVELAAAIGIPMLASREEGSTWAGARTGAVMTVLAATVVLAWGATGLPPFPQIDLGPIIGLSIAELLGIIVALAVIALVGLVLGTIGGVIGRWLERRARSGDAARA